MAKLSRAERKSRGITLTPRTGCWVYYQLRLRSLTLVKVAEKANVTPNMVTQFLKGIKNSVKVKAALAEMLGYENFEKLVAASRGKEAVAV
jgi:transcriptional regulator with XRE-family HTH domain